MSLPVFIPSRGRHAAHWFERGPEPFIKDIGNYWFVVPSEEQHLYLKHTDRVIARPPAVQGIGMVREYIGKLCDFNGWPKFIMFDDDFKFFRRVSAESTKLQRATTEDMRRMLMEVETQLDDYCAVGISARQGNNNNPPGGPELHLLNTRLNGVTAYRTEEYLSVEHCRVEVMEDFDVMLQLLRLGYPNKSLCYWAYNQTQTNAEGGCSLYRTQEMQKRSAEKLAELHAPFVKTRVKENKTGGEFGTRTDVTVFWKKAFADGVDTFGEQT